MSSFHPPHDFLILTKRFEEEEEEEEEGGGALKSGVVSPPSLPPLPPLPPFHPSSNCVMASSRRGLGGPFDLRGYPLVLVSGVLADEGAVLVELDLLVAVVHQAVAALPTYKGTHTSTQRREGLEIRNNLVSFMASICVCIGRHKCLCVCACVYVCAWVCACV
uniref:Uncharacterized protein n=1 Tax=Gadus morhua TaxID=8049 RepID=A0A8C5BEF3_GADMO